MVSRVGIFTVTQILFTEFTNMVFVGILAICKLKVTKIAQMVVVFVLTVGEW